MISSALRRRPLRSAEGFPARSGAKWAGGRLAAAGAAVMVLALLLAASGLAAGPASALDSHALVAPAIGVGHDPRGVAVDRATDTVYVANFRSDTVSVIDGHTRKVTATVGVGHNPGALGPDGVAVDPATDTIYVTNFGSDTASVIRGS